MTWALLLGILAGSGALVAIRALFPPPPPLRPTMDRFYRRAPAMTPLTRLADEPDDLSMAVGRRVGGLLRRWSGGLGLSRPRLARDLAIVGRPLEQHLGQKVLLALFGLALPSLLGLMLGAVGLSFGLALPVGLALILGASFFFVPDLGLRNEAAQRRRGFRHALGAFLDLVVISLAGGAGVETALRTAAATGDGWAFGQLRRAIDSAELTGETPWAVLARLGDELDVPELEELAASVSLAGTEGARVRESLTVKAASIRSHTLSKAESEAMAATETLSLPVSLLFVGFLVLIGYPAVSRVLIGFG